MSRLVLAVAFALSSLAAATARAEEGRFDVQLFRPSGGPRDLVMVTQSQPLSHFSVAAGVYLGFALDPLVLVRTTGDRSRSAKIVGDRFELDAMATVGLFDWVELGVVMPLILFQASDNLHDLGTEGTIPPTALGDLRLTAKAPIPGLRRKRAEDTGFGAAVTLGVNLPTGNQSAFASDGSVTAQPGVVADYRIKGGALVAINAGLWARPARELAGLQVGTSLSLGTGVEVPIVRRWGIGVIGNLYGYVPLGPLPRKINDVSIEFLLGVRWYSSSGFTLTVGAGGGDCGWGSPTLRLFASLIWVPTRTREWAAIEHYKKPPPPDPDRDKDGVINERDRCPDVFGPVENNGCPDEDRDRDGIVDRLDHCPDEYARPGLDDGCPRVSIRKDKITIIEQVHFATDQDVILPESFPILEEVSAVLVEHKEIEKLVIEGHTDVRATDAYNLDLSRRRADAVRRFLVAHGVATERVRAEGFGRRRPIGDNATEAGMAVNRRVEFTIEKMNAPPTPVAPSLPERTPVLPDVGPSKSVLPGRSSELPWVEPGKGVLPPAQGPSQKSVLPTVKEAPREGTVLPTVPPPKKKPPLPPGAPN